MKREEIEKTLKNICVGANSAEAMARSVLKLGLPEPFCVWGEEARFIALRMPDRGLVFSGDHKIRQRGAPQKYMIGSEPIFGWFLPIKNHMLV